MLSNTIAIVFLVLQLLVSSVTAFDRNKGKSTIIITCDSLSQSDCQNDTLQTIAEQVEEQSDVNIDIRIPHIRLNSTLKFNNLNSLRISAGAGHVTVIACTDSHDGHSAGIVMRNISNLISLTNLTFSRCGSCVENVYTKGEFYCSALTIVSCRKFEAKWMTIEKSQGIGLMILNHKGGMVNIHSALFKENKLPQKYANESKLGGGGVYMLLGRILQDMSYSHMSFQFLNCTFKLNEAHAYYYNYIYSNILGETQEGYGRGGGVHLAFVRESQDVFVSFSGNQFIENEAFVGGGLSAKVFGINHHISNISVEIKNTLFKKNGCNSAYFGGGLILDFQTLIDESFWLTDIHYLVKNVSFIENCARLGGGVYYTSNRDRYGDLKKSVEFDNCTFKENQAHVGSAVNMGPSFFIKLSTGFMIVPVFKNCFFIRNKMYAEKLNDVQMTAGFDTIHASQYDIHFHGHNHFEDNWGTAIYIINGILNFKNSSAIFIGNKGFRGGAIALTGSSTIYVGPHTYNFINNTASDRGGAIYVEMIDSNDFTISRSCFIQYADNVTSLLSSEWNANITFIGNRVNHSSAGHAIYATSLHSCQVINNGSDYQQVYALINVEDVLIKRFIRLDPDKGLQPQVATDGVLFTNVMSKVLKIIPGEKHPHGLKIKDDFNRNVDATFSVTIQSDHSNIHLDSSFSSYVGDTIQLNGKTKETANITFHIASPRNSYVQFPVEMQECPPGFQINEDELKCVCNTDAYVGLLECNTSAFYSHIIPGYWAGFLQTSDGHELVTSPCAYCDYNKNLTKSNYMSTFKVALPRTRDHSELNAAICGETRTGVICGKCQEGYTVHFHSPGYLCKPAKPVGCKLGWLFYILSELVPVTVVFIIVLVLNISFTSGAVNGFILFTQLLESLHTDAKFLPSTSQRATNGYKVIYGFFDLNLFNSESLSFCIWKGATPIDMISFKYVTLLYTLLLIVAVICLMNKYGGRCCGKYCRITTIRTSVIHGISSFLVICYTQFVNTFLNLLGPAHLYARDNSDFKPSVRVWLNGDIVYFSKQHLPYALPSILSLITIGLVPPALLITFPLLNKVLAFFGCKDSRISGIYRIYGFKPLLDSFQGCFKDNFRFFAGLYFLYRWMFLVIYMNTSDYGSYCSAVSCALVVVLSLHTFCQPYRERLHNIIDAALMADLLFINALSSVYHYHRSHYQLNSRYNFSTIPSILQIVLIYLPLVIMGVYLLAISCKAAVKIVLRRNKVHNRRACKIRKLARLLSGQKDHEYGHNIAIDDFSYDRQRDDSTGFSSTGEYFNKL